MPKVLIVATSRKTRGGITSVVKAHEQGPQWKEFHCHWVETHRDGPGWRKLAYFFRAIFDYSVRLPFYDMVHIHFSNISSLKRKLIFARIAKRMNKKILIHFHAFNPDTTIHGKQKELYREMFEMADGIIVLSNWWRDEVKKAFPTVSERILVLYNPCKQIPTGTSVTKKKQILYAGTVNARKGYADLIKAFAIIATKHPDWALALAGNGELEKAKQLANGLGISSQVKFLGWVSGDSKRQAFHESSIFCLPSYAEGFPMAVLDAWAYGLPVVTTPVGGIPDVAIDGQNMLLFTSGDIDSLAFLLERMIGDDVLREKISIASRHFAENEFSIRDINARLGEIYENIMVK